MSKMSNNHRRNYSRYAKPQWEVEAELAEKKRQEEIARNIENTEENFPTLVPAAVAKPFSWGGTSRGFAQLAAEWKADDDMRKEAEERAKANPQKDDMFGSILPKFNPVHRFVEMSDETPAPAPPAETQAVAEDDDETGWVTVDNRAKREAQKSRKIARKDAELRRLDELGDALPDHESSDDSDTGEGETCWNDAPQAHETCWEGRAP